MGRTLDCRRCLSAGTRMDEDFGQPNTLGITIFIEGVDHKGLLVPGRAWSPSIAGLLRFAPDSNQVKALAVFFDSITESYESAPTATESRSRLHLANVTMGLRRWAPDQAAHACLVRDHQRLDGMHNRRVEPLPADRCGTTEPDTRGAMPERGGHWAALDGVRAAAVGSVMLYHLYRPHLLPGGYLGVDVFFVLSGFLITWGLVTEWDRDGGVSYRRFYLRRALRLLPALGGVLALAAVLVGTSLQGSQRASTVAGIPWIIFYVGNWARAIGASDLGALAHLWSLAVEEQFYLLWPLLLVALLRARLRRQGIAAGLVGLAVVEAIYREALYRSGISVERLVNGLDTHSDGLMAGCAVALLLSSGALRRAPARALKVGAWASATLLVVLAETGNGNSSFQWGYPLAALGAAVVIAALVIDPPGGLNAVLGSRPAVWVGRRSYGLYVWSYPIYYALPWPRGFTGWPRDLAEIGLSFVVAATSYRILESPFLRLKHRMRQRASAVS